jgi:CheY-like chemotaxis protein
LLTQLPQPISGATAHAYSQRAKPLVLVVDDHADTRELLSYMMAMLGFGFAEAADGEQAVQLAQKLLPDLILMDTSLPRIDGLMATRRIRQLDCIHNVGIIFLSGHAEPQMRDSALAAGGDDYFVKPVNFEALEVALRKRLLITRSCG